MFTCTFLTYTSGKQALQSLEHTKFNWKMVSSIFMLIFIFGIVSLMSSILLLDKLTAQNNLHNLILG